MEVWWRWYVCCLLCVCWRCMCGRWSIRSIAAAWRHGSGCQARCAARLTRTRDDATDLDGRSSIGRWWWWCWWPTDRYLVSWRTSCGQYRLTDNGMMVLNDKTYINNGGGRPATWPDVVGRCPGWTDLMHLVVILWYRSDRCTSFCGVVHSVQSVHLCTYMYIQIRSFLFFLRLRFCTSFVQRISYSPKQQPYIFYTCIIVM